MIVHFKDRDARWAELDATLVNVSRGGMLVRCERVPHPSDRVLVGMIYRAHGLCAAWGRAVRASDGRFAIALRRSDERWASLIDELVTMSPTERTQRLASGTSGRLWVESAAA